MENNRKLFDVIFEIGLTIHEHPFFKNKSTQEVAEWITDQLNKNGFYNLPIGSCWGVPVSKEVYEKYKNEKDDYWRVPTKEQGEYAFTTFRNYYTTLSDKCYKACAIVENAYSLNQKCEPRFINIIDEMMSADTNYQK